MKLTKSRIKEKGFSLVEVSVAMAIAAIALVSLIGLIPTGLKTLRDAGDQAIYGRIQQQILSEIQLTPFRSSTYSGGGLKSGDSPLEDFHKQIRIYDQQGVEIGYLNESGGFKKSVSYQGSVNENWAYSARIWLPAFAGSGDDGLLPVSLGGHTTDGLGVVYSEDLETSEEMITVVVEIVPLRYPNDTDSPTQSGAEDYLSDEDNFRSIHHFQSTVVRMGTDFFESN